MKNIHPKKLYWAPANYFELRLPGQAVVDLSGPGEKSEAASYWAGRIRALSERDAFTLAPTDDKIRKELQEYGAWDEVELRDAQANWRRLIWVMACAIAEEESPACGAPSPSFVVKCTGLHKNGSMFLHESEGATPTAHNRRAAKKAARAQALATWARRVTKTIITREVCRETRWE